MDTSRRIVAQRVSATGVVLLLGLGALCLGARGGSAQQAEEETIAPHAVGTMSDLMVKIIYPTSDAILYITTRTPTDEAGWNELQGKALMLAHSANLMMLPFYARDNDQWMRDSKLMLDAGEAAYKAALAKDVDALAELNDPLYQSCVTCHLHYRPNYGK